MRENSALCLSLSGFATRHLTSSPSCFSYSLLHLSLRYGERVFTVLPAAILNHVKTFSFQVKHNPYFSHGDRGIVIAEHDEKCRTDPLHKTIEADINALKAKNTRTGIRSTKFFDSRSIAKSSTVDAVILAALDYNTV